MEQPGGLAEALAAVGIGSAQVLEIKVTSKVMSPPSPPPPQPPSPPLPPSPPNRPPSPFSPAGFAWVPLHTNLNALEALRFPPGGVDFLPHSTAPDLFALAKDDGLTIQVPPRRGQACLLPAHQAPSQAQVSGL